MDGACRWRNRDCAGTCLARVPTGELTSDDSGWNQCEKCFGIDHVISLVFDASSYRWEYLESSFTGLSKQRIDNRDGGDQTACLYLVLTS